MTQPIPEIEACNIIIEHIKCATKELETFASNVTPRSRKFPKKANYQLTN